MKDYLLISPHLSVDTSPLYQVFKTPAHTHAAQVCLGILLHLDNSITQESLQEYPLAEYAAKHWIDHARFEDIQQDVEDGLRALFDPSKAHLSILIWIHNPVIPSQRQTEQAEMPSKLTGLGTSLHYAAFYNLPKIVKYLIIKQSADINSTQGFNSSDYLEATPLHVVSTRGHIEVAQILLYHGADATAEDKHGWTPLHRSSHQGHVELTQMLLEHSADVTALNDQGSTPLHKVSQGGCQKVVLLLLKYHAGIAALDNLSWTPLHHSCLEGHAKVA